MTLKSNRSGTVAIGAAGVALAVASTLLLGSGRWLLGAVVAVFALLAVWITFANQFRAGLELGPLGIRVRTAGKGWSASWMDLAGFRPDTMRVGRGVNTGTIDIVAFEFTPDYISTHPPPSFKARATANTHDYVPAAYGGLTSRQLAGLLEEWRQRAVGG